MTIRIYYNMIVTRNMHMSSDLRPPHMYTKPHLLFSGVFLWSFVQLVVQNRTSLVQTHVCTDIIGGNITGVHVGALSNSSNVALAGTI